MTTVELTRMTSTLTRRQIFGRSAPGIGAAIVMGLLHPPHAPAGSADVPDEPVEIGTWPQLFVDDYLVDNRFAVKKSGTEMVLRKFHAPVKHGDRAVLVDPETVPSQHAFRFDREAKLFRIWYQAQVPIEGREDRKPGALAGVSAHPLRGVEGRHPLDAAGPRPRRISRQHAQQHLVSRGRGSSPIRAWSARTGSGISSMRFLNEDEMPEADRRGYKYLMTYTQRGGGKEEEDKTQVYLIGTTDGIHWDREHQMSIFTGAISDGWMGMNYDPERKKYVSYCRPRDRYEGGPFSRARRGLLAG